MEVVVAGCNHARRGPLNVQRVHADHTLHTRVPCLDVARPLCLEQQAVLGEVRFDQMRLLQPDMTASHFTWLQGPPTKSHAWWRVWVIGAGDTIWSVPTSR